MDIGKRQSISNLPIGPGTWPTWARRLVSALILFHVAAVLAGAFQARPSSDLERSIADLFEPYHQAIDQGVSYRYYSTAFPPTPVVTATLTFGDGRPDKVVRIPDRGLRPRLLFQRQLAIAHGLMEDFEAAHRHDDDGARSRWAYAFATHLGRVNPGCSSVSLDVHYQLIPTIERIQRHWSKAGSDPIDLDDAEFSTEPRHIGDYPCNASGAG